VAFYDGIWIKNMLSSNISKLDKNSKLKHTNANLAKKYNQNITKHFIPKETKKPKQVVQNMVNDTIET
jgi:hypothetical protein